MITAIIIGFLASINFLISCLPFSIPAMPSDFVSASDFITSNIGQVFSFISYFLGSGFLLALITMLIVYINFDFIFNLFFWVFRKIPGLGIDD